MPSTARFTHEPFVGRTAELTSMREAAQEAIDGRSTAILVQGAPGIGKSALLREFGRRTPEFRTITIAGFADEATLPYGLITQLALALRTWGHDPGRTRATPDGDPVAVGLDLLETLSVATADSPVLLLVDDLHLADPESALVLRFLLRRLWVERICTAITTDALGNDPGSGSIAALPADAATVRLTLPGLNRQDLTELLTDRWGRADAALVDRLTQWTGGNPTLVRAILSDDGWTERTAADPPTAFGAAVRAVVRRLPADARRVLDALSVLRTPAPPATLRAVAGVAGPVAELVEPLLSAHLVREVGTGRPDVDSASGLEFENAALRTATERNLDDPTRRRLHAAAAEHTSGADRLAHLVAAAPGRDPALARILATQAQVEAAAGDLVRAGRYATWAAGLADDETERASRLTDAVRLFVRVGRSGAALRLAAGVDALHPSWRRDEATGLLAFARGEPATALPLLTRAEPAAESPAARAQIAVEIATVAVTLFSGELALAAATRVRALTDDPGLDRLAAATAAFGHGLLDGPAAALADLGDLPDAPADCTEQDLTGLTFRGIFRGLVGRFDDAIADLTVAARRREATRMAVFGVTAHIHLASCQLNVGLWEVAEQTLEVATELSDVYGRAYDHAALRSSSAVVLAWRGDLTGARRELAESVRLSAHLDFLGPAFHQVLARAVIAWSERAYGEVINLLRPWLTGAADRARVDLFGLWWLPLLADAQVTSGRTRDAAVTLERLAALDAEPGSMRDTALAWLRGRLARRAGDLTTSLRILGDEVARPSFAGRRNLYSGMVLLALGEAQHAAGHQTDARRSFAAAIERLDAMGATPLAARSRERMAVLFAEPEPPRRRAVLDRLTEKEAQVAALVGRGWTNPEIAKTLFVSTKTVEYHLRNIFIKLDLSGRRQLRDLLQTPDAA